MKKCPNCGNEKELTEFYIRNGKPRSQCKACENARVTAWKKANPERVAVSNRAWERCNPERKAVLNKAWRLANKEQIVSSNKAWYLHNKERHAASNKAWQLANPERRAAYLKAWRLANRERLASLNKSRYLRDRERIVSLNKAWKRANREKTNRDNRLRRLSDPIYKLVRLMRGRMRDVLKGISKHRPTILLLGGLEETKRHLESQFRDGMTWENHGPVWHIDHVKPIAKFDLTKPEQQAVCFHYTNLQPLFAAENLSKGAKYDTIPRQ